MIKKKPFRKYTLDEDKKVKKRELIVVSVNIEERKQLDKDKKVIKQHKDSTAIKTLAEIGSIVIHDEKMRLILGALFKNQRNNERLGLPEFE